LSTCRCVPEWHAPSFLSRPRDPPPLHSFPTRRSSDLAARCVWAADGYGNGVRFHGDVQWNRTPRDAMALLEAADLVVVHNGKVRSEEHTSELQSRSDLVCRLLLEKKKTIANTPHAMPT